MMKRLTNLLLGIILLAGLSLLLYPTVSNYWNSFHQSHAIASYAEAVNQLDDTDYDALWAEVNDYNAKIAMHGNRMSLTLSEMAEYNSLLDITGTGVMGYIDIPAIEVELPIYHGTEESVLQIACGHIAGTSLPVGGESTHSVLSGHRGLPSAKLFTDLDQLVYGDIFTMQILNETLTYMVDQVRIVLPDELGDLAIENGKDYVTLVTCTPYGINTHRLLVRGHRVETEGDEAEVLVVQDANQISTTTVALFIGVPMVLIMSCFMMLHKRKDDEFDLA